MNDGGIAVAFASIRMILARGETFHLDGDTRAVWRAGQCVVDVSLPRSGRLSAGADTRIADTVDFHLAGDVACRSGIDREVLVK